MESDYKIRKKPFPKGYPAPGTKLAQVLECLEAEPATCEEISEYLSTTMDIASALAIRLMGDGLVQRISKGRYQLMDPVLVSLIYNSLEQKTKIFG